MRKPVTAEKSRRERQICKKAELVWGKVGLLIEKRRLFNILIIENYKHIAFQGHAIP